MTEKYKFEKGKEPKIILLCGYFSQRTEKISQTFDPLIDRWNITVRLEKERLLYKYIVND